MLFFYYVILARIFFMTETKIKVEDLPTVYDAKSTEEKMYKFWEDGEYFKADAHSKKPPFTIVIPPPNVTGVLHMGHALDGTLQDILTRYHRMSGYEALWVPGTDHAGIATQAVVEKQLRKEGLTRHDLGREEFLKRTWAWANEHKSAILNQFKRLGASFDRSRERFTFDEGCSEAVKEVFVTLYNKGLIYKGAYIVNWCPRCQSAISDIETEYETEQGHLWEISYPLVGESGAIIVATTRPETMFGDVAIAVNPSDKKYSELIGKTVMIPLSGRQIPIIADEYVDKSFGTGAVKITPAHDPNDYEVGKRHNFKPIWVIDEEGKMKSCAEVPLDYQGLDRYEARKKVVDMLSYNNFLLRVKDHEHNVGKCQRCNTTIEPLLSEQWFVKMGPLAKEAIAAVKDGRIEFIPERWEKNYLGWMENIRDWCISRQLWWGHQIPAYYHKQTGEMVVAKENPDPENYVQDTDCLDTWFSSGLWPFSTMGFPNAETDDYKKFYPTSVLVTGFDIIFFWVARMITMGLEFTGKAPFSKVYIHGLIRDEKGQKMSKSKGNTIDPVQIIDKYGCDALRFTMTSLCTYGGQDIKVSDERFEYGRNFANKIWNASRFVMMNLEGVDNKAIDKSKLTLVDKWILNQLNETAKIVNENMKEYRIGEIAHTLYDFFRSEYCDWYVEIAKIQLQDPELKANTQRVLRYVLDMSLRMLHPIMPHITEEIWQTLPHEGDALIVAQWPEYCQEHDFPEAELEMQRIMDVIRGVRNRRAEMNVPPSRKTNLYIATAEPNTFENGIAILNKLAYATQITIGQAFDIEGAVTIVTNDAKVYIPMDELVDKKAELARLNKELETAKKQFAQVNGKLNNQGFLTKAPAQVVEGVKKDFDTLTERIQLIESSISALQS
ncbi:valine--tRNA ligase [bacterium]|nr:valine--tRNA ligase [bacterium]